MVPTDILLFRLHAKVPALSSPEVATAPVLLASQIMARSGSVDGRQIRPITGAVGVTRTARHHGKGHGYRIAVSRLLQKCFFLISRSRLAGEFDAETAPTVRIAMGLMFL